MKKRFNTDFYHEIDKLCIKNKITHRKLAELVGVSEVTMSRYLTGERKLQLSVFMKMCKIFEITPDELYKIYMEQVVETYYTERKHKIRKDTINDN